MAVIGTLETTFLAPGVSRNKRLYTPEIIARAVARMQERLADPTALPITMLSHHGANDDSKELCARVATCEMDPATYRASLFAYLIDTRAGRDIAAATETDPDGRRTLDAVSIRGYWMGPVRMVEYQGEWVETGDDIEIEGVDFTKDPGVLQARIGSTTRVTTEAHARTPITESVEVTVMSDSRLVHSTSTPAPGPSGQPLPDPPGTEESGSSSVAGDDGAPAKQTATETTETRPEATLAERAAALGPVTTDNARERLDATIAALREAWINVSAWQGPVDIDMDAWGISNDDLPAAMTQMGMAAQAALKVLDPDQDGDLDLPDDEAVCGNCDAVLPAGAAFCPACGTAASENLPEESNTEKESTVTEQSQKPDEGAPKGGPAGAATTESDDAAGAEGTTTTPTDAPAEGEGQEEDGATLPALTAADHKAIADLLMAAGQPVGAGAPAESTDKSTPTTEAAPAGGLTLEQVTGAMKGAMQESAATLTETITKQVADKLRGEMVEAYGTPRRRGLVETAKAAGEVDAEALAKMTPAEFQAHAATAWNTVLGAPADN